MSNYNSTLQSNNTDLQAILNTINGLPNAGGSDPVLQDKTVTPSTASQTITADSNYDGLSKVTVNAMPTVTQATPSITINASGLITATATQTAGYVTAGSKSATKQLAFQAAKTITPTTTNQTAVSSGYYTGGVITVKGDSNLVAGNIKSGVSIFGVNGTYAGSGGDTTAEDGLITRNIISYANDRVTTIGYNAFFSCHSLTTVNFPKVTAINDYAFNICKKLVTVSFPEAKHIGGGAFSNCSSLTSVNFPNATYLGYSVFYNCIKLATLSLPKVTALYPSVFYSCPITAVEFPKVTMVNGAFYNCPNLTTISLPSATNIIGGAFLRCYNLKSLYLTGSSICALSTSIAFGSTPIGGYSKTAGTYGSIYVPASLLASYKTATNWTYFSSRFVGI